MYRTVGTTRRTAKDHYDSKFLNFSLLLKHEYIIYPHVIIVIPIVISWSAYRVSFYTFRAGFKIEHQHHAAVQSNHYSPVLFTLKLSSLTDRRIQSNLNFLFHLLSGQIDSLNLLALISKSIIWPHVITIGFKFLSLTQTMLLMSHLK